jgi:hypothetical protein
LSPHQSARCARFGLGEGGGVAVGLFLGGMDVHRLSYGVDDHFLALSDEDWISRPKR